jgi:hypothetical protein
VFRKSKSLSPQRDTLFLHNSTHTFNNLEDPRIEPLHGTHTFPCD